MCGLRYDGGRDRASFTALKDVPSASSALLSTGPVE